MTFFCFRDYNKKEYRQFYTNKDVLNGASGRWCIMGKEVIIACDFNNKKDLCFFLDRFIEEKLFLKIGMELFYSEGPEIVRYVKERGHKVFLDLKLHDIPNTVKKTMAVLAKMDIDMCNVHAAGTRAMMLAAMDGLNQYNGNRPLLIAVTQLTSTSQESMQNELLIDLEMQEAVLHYAENAKVAGLDGVVCSPLEVQAVHDKLGQDFLTITPGVRFLGSDKGDQERVTTPKMAKELGSDYIVVGRPITEADNPVEVYHRCVLDFIDQT